MGSSVDSKNANRLKNVKLVGTLADGEIWKFDLASGTMIPGADIGGLVDSVNTKTGVVVLDADDISDAATTNKYNITHTSEVAGSGALTVQPIAVSNKALITASGTMEVLVNDAGTLKKVVASDFLGGGATDIQNTIFVTDNGATSGVRADFVGNMLTPVTLDYASAIALSGDRIHVFAGTHTVTITTLSVIGVVHYFELGAIVNKSTAGSLFTKTASFSTGGNVYGLGAFYCSGSAGRMFANSKASVDCVFEGDIAESTSNSIIQSTVNCNDTIRFRTKIFSSASFCIFTYYARTFIECPFIDSTASYCINRALSVSTKINGVDITSSVSDGITGSVGASMNVDASYISSVNTTSTTQQVLNVGKIDNLTGADHYMTGQVGYYDWTGGDSFVGQLDDLQVGTAVSGTLDAMVMNLTGSWNMTSTQQCSITARPAKAGTTYNASGKTFYIDGTGVQFRMVGEWSWISNLFWLIKGELIMDANYRVGEPNVTVPFKITDGIMRFNGLIDNKSTSVNLRSSIDKFGGELIINGGVIITPNQDQKAIAAPTTAQNVKIYSGGFTTNRANSLAGDKKKVKFTGDTASQAASLTINGVTFTATPDTIPIMMDELTTLINASVDVSINGVVTASQDTPLTDLYLYVEADVANVDFTYALAVYGAYTRIIQHSEILTDVVGGQIIEDTNVQ